MTLHDCKPKKNKRIWGKSPWGKKRRAVEELEQEVKLERRGIVYVI
jgi:hypothetical protein